MPTNTDEIPCTYFGTELPMFSYDKMITHRNNCYFPLLNALKDVAFQCRHLRPLRKSEVDCVDLKQTHAAIAMASEAKLFEEGATGE